MVVGPRGTRMCGPQVGAQSHLGWGGCASSNGFIPFDLPQLSIDGAPIMSKELVKTGIGSTAAMHEGTPIWRRDVFSLAVPTH